MKDNPYGHDVGLFSRRTFQGAPDTYFCPNGDASAGWISPVACVSEVGPEEAPRFLRVSQVCEERRLESTHGVSRRQEVVPELARLDDGAVGSRHRHERQPASAGRQTRLAVSHPFLKGVMDGRDDPQWWLEASSYPIRVLDPSRVEVLLRSMELEARYGEAPVAVLFRHGDGEVFHMISHYYLQRTELRTARHATPAAEYATEKGVAWGPDLDGLTVADVESAATSARFVANVVAAKKRGQRNGGS